MSTKKANAKIVILADKFEPQTGEPVAIILTNIEQAALRAAGEIYFAKVAREDRIRSMVHLTIRLALAHPNVLHDWIAQMVHYTRAEDLSQEKFMNARIADQPVYGMVPQRRVKR